MIEHLLNPVPEPTETFDPNSHSHRRYNPLTCSYVLCSPHRSKRPFPTPGPVENRILEEKLKRPVQERLKRPFHETSICHKTTIAEFDPRCYLCPGNVRATGKFNPKYNRTYVFLNDYPAVINTESPVCSELNGESKCLKKKLFKGESVRGKCYVICFNPKHGLSIPLMSQMEVLAVVECWSSLYDESSQDFSLRYLQIFENKGSIMGSTNAHPHGQAWALNVIPSEVERETKHLIAYYNENHSHMFADYIELELAEEERIVVQNDSFLVVVPYWATWPFETLLMSKKHLRSSQDFTPKQKVDLASIIRMLNIKYDNLFGASFPYAMGIHQSPFNCPDYLKEHSWYHMHFYPPLWRSATTKKHLVGFELLGENQRDLTSEQAAARLKDSDGETHYLQIDQLIS